MPDPNQADHETTQEILRTTFELLRTNATESATLRGEIRGAVEVMQNAILLGTGRVDEALKRVDLVCQTAKAHSDIAAKREADEAAKAAKAEEKEATRSARAWGSFTSFVSWVQKPLMIFLLGAATYYVSRLGSAPTASVAAVAQTAAVAPTAATAPTAPTAAVAPTARTAPTAYYGAEQ